MFFYLLHGISVFALGRILFLHISLSFPFAAGSHLEVLYLSKFILSLQAIKTTLTTIWTEGVHWAFESKFGEGYCEPKAASFFLLLRLLAVLSPPLLFSPVLFPASL